MDKKEFAQIAAALGSAYGDKKYLQTAEDVSLWYSMLRDLDYTCCRAAVQQIIATSRFHPTIAEIREKASAVRQPQTLDWSEAWGSVVYAIRRYGMYREQEAMEGMDSLTRRCVGYLGYRNLCLSESPETDRANFRMMYQNIARREQEERQIPEAVKQAMLGIRDSMGIEKKEGQDGRGFSGEPAGGEAGRMVVRDQL